MAKINRQAKKASRRPKNQAFKFYLEQFDYEEIETLILAAKDETEEITVSGMNMGTMLFIAIVYAVHSVFHGEKTSLASTIGKDRNMPQVINEFFEIWVYELVRRRGCYERVTFASNPVTSKNPIDLQGPNLEVIRQTRAEFEQKGIPILSGIDEDSPAFARLLGVNLHPTLLSTSLHKPKQTH